MDKIKDSGSLAQGSIPCGFTILCHILLIFKIWHIFLHNNCATIYTFSAHVFFSLKSLQILILHVPKPFIHKKSALVTIAFQKN